MATDNTSGIEERLERIEKSLAAITEGLHQAPTMVSMATDSIDEMVREAKSKGIYVDERLKNGLQILSRLSDPQVHDSLNSLIDLVEMSPGLISIMADSVDEEMGKANSGPVRVDERIQGLAHLLMKLSNPEMINQLDGLLKLSHQAPGMIAMMVDSLDNFMKDNTALDPANFVFIKNAAESLTEAQSQEPAKVGGFFGTIRTLRDPDRQRALGFIMNFLKNLGKKI